MINETGYQLGKNYLGTNFAGRGTQQKTSVNKYYNIFTRKLEEMVLPNIDLEHNTPINSEISTFSRLA